MLAEVKVEDTSRFFEGLNEKEIQSIQTLFNAIKQTNYTPMTEDEVKDMESRSQFAYDNNRLEGLFLDVLGERIIEVLDYFLIPLDLRPQLVQRAYLT